MHGRELWRSDGTSSDTTLICDIFTGLASADPSGFTNVNGLVYFIADDGIHGSELWRSDGTSSGTFLVHDILAGIDGATPLDLTNVNGTLFFRADNGLKGSELWQSDGTSSGTTLVADLWLGSEGARPTSLANVNGKLFFQADDGIHGSELWRSDGTSTGTVLVCDITPGAGDAFPGQLTNVNGMLYFVAHTDTTGTELWKSDGTSLGTVLARDIFPGTDSSFPALLTNVNGALYFQANDGITGNEPWTAEPAIRFTSDTVSVRGGGEANAVTVVFTGPNDYMITIDGESQSFTTTEHRTINIETGDGADTLGVTLSSLADLVTFAGLTGSVSSSNYTISFSGVERAWFHGNGLDNVVFNDPGAVNTAYLLPAYGIVQAPAYFNQAIGFTNYTVNAAGNNDRLLIYGDSGNQNYTATATGRRCRWTLTT